MLSVTADIGSVSIDGGNSPSLFEGLLLVSAQWISEGFPVFYKPLYWVTDKDTGSDKLIKGGWTLCTEGRCKEDRDLHLEGYKQGSGCDCAALLCHGEYRATLDIVQAAGMLARALKQTNSSRSVAVSVRIPRGFMALDIDRKDIHTYDPLVADDFVRLDRIEGFFDPDKGEPRLGRTAATIGGGFHYWYRLPDRAVSLPRLLVKDVEIKAEGDCLTVAGTEPRGVSSYDTDLTRPIPLISASMLNYLEGKHRLEVEDKAVKAKASTATRFRQPNASPRKGGSADPASLVLERLESLGRRWRPSGARQWVAQCPAHTDNSPSLSLKAAEDRALVNCFAGCDTSAVLTALNLSTSDLFRSQP